MSRSLVQGTHTEADKILSIVFRERVKWTVKDALSVDDGPWVLSHVCKSWRMICLSHPELWSAISFGAQGDDDSDSDFNSEEGGSLGPVAGLNSDPLSLLNLVLERTQTQPLKITLEFALGTAYVNTLLSHQLIQALVSQSHRWEEADLNITNAEISLFAPIRNRLSQLVKLSIALFNDDDELPGRFPYTENAPRLSDLTLYGLPHQNVSVPWARITHFSEELHQQASTHGSRRSVDASKVFLEILRANPHMESFRVDYPGLYKSSGVPSRFNHPSLRYFSARDSRLIGALILPKLNELFVDKPIFSTLPALRQLLSRSQCSLRSFRLAESSINDEVITLLSITVQLEELVLQHVGWDAVDDTMMCGLIQRMSEASFLPNLAVLDIDISPAESSDFLLESVVVDKPTKLGFVNDAFVAMIAKRWERRAESKWGAHINAVSVWCELPATVSLSRTRGVMELRRLSDEGLDVVVKTRDPRALKIEDGDGKDVSYVYNLQ
ncbi:hypothetical protein BDZ89DRAFT_1071719 [Hymenopellis radicata]|nr:hypothetical protein BDZ89DRAFT_1071719 [Hymenopellis radicata]